MLRFFRQIRQKLLENGNIRKYIWYALGEIFLVVIGILIALQINNWNENRKLQEAQNSYLIRLHDDFNSMQIFYSDGYGDYPELVKQAEQAFQYVFTCGADSALKESMSAVLITHQNLPMFTSVNGTYDEMIASGVYASLPNEELKSYIFSFYGGVEYGRSLVNYSRDELGRASSIIWEHVDFVYDPDGEYLVFYDIEEICTSRKFKNAMAEIVDARKDWQAGWGFLSDRIALIKEQLETQLQQ